jgi:hypothetical protein
MKLCLSETKGYEQQTHNGSVGIDRLLLFLNFISRGGGQQIEAGTLSNRENIVWNYIKIFLVAIPTESAKQTEEKYSEEKDTLASCLLWEYRYI